jgi:hypothetical protein
MSTAAPPSRPQPRRPLKVVLRVRRPKPVQPPCPRPAAPRDEIDSLQRWIDLYA